MLASIGGAMSTFDKFSGGPKQGSKMGRETTTNTEKKTQTKQQ